MAWWGSLGAEQPLNSCFPLPVREGVITCLAHRIIVKDMGGDEMLSALTFNCRVDHAQEAVLCNPGLHKTSKHPLCNYKGFLGIIALLQNQRSPQK